MRHRKVKVIATLGPSSSSPEMIEALFSAGADVFRLNMSHLTHEGLRSTYQVIREIESQVERPIGILADLQGPKLRVGEVSGGGAVLQKGQGLRLQLDPIAGDAERISIPHPEIFAAIDEGQNLLLDDGKIRLRVTHKGHDFADAEVLVGGRLSSRKGVNVPDAVLPLPALTEKDRRDLEAAVELGVDWVALSFIQRPEDVADARKLARGRAQVMAKIEKPQALTHLNDIIDMADGLMVARGDLGVELPVEQVPGRQKQIIHAARAAGKPVVVATQMLESMIDSPMPTRAEVSDVATAVFEGADAIMLSAESAAGKYPIEAVQMMDRVAQEAEDDPTYVTSMAVHKADPEATGADAISAAAHTVAETLKAAAIVCYTNSGSTALRAARERPNLPIVSLTPILSTARRLALVWGLHSVHTDDASDLDDMVERACRIANEQGLARSGERVIVMAGVPLGTPGATNMLRVAFVNR